MKTYTHDDWLAVRWDKSGSAEDAEDQPKVDEFLQAKKAASDGDHDAMKAFIESLGLGWKEMRHPDTGRGAIVMTNRPNAEAQLPPEQPKAAEGTRSATALRAVHCSDLLYRTRTIDEFDFKIITIPDANSAFPVRFRVERIFEFTCILTTADCRFVACRCDYGTNSLLDVECASEPFSKLFIPVSRPPRDPINVRDLTVFGFIKAMAPQTDD